MVALRCTQRLLSRLHVASPSEPGESTTTLGDWYANTLMIARRPYVMCTSERSKLTVIIPFKGATTLRERFRNAVGALLHAIHIPASVIEDELKEMDPIEFGRTRNRSLLGNMKDLTLPAEDWLLDHPESTLLDIDVRLSKHLVGPDPYVVPRELALKILTGAA